MVNVALHGRFNVAQKGNLLEPYRGSLYDVKTRKSREAEARQVPKMFSWQDFEALGTLWCIGSESNGTFGCCQ